MNAQCAQCGEELLGAVNRCWRCGTDFVSPVDSAELPPVRRPPLAASAAMPDSHEADVSPTEPDRKFPENRIAESGYPDSNFGSTAPIQVGSPFREGSQHSPDTGSARLAGGGVAQPAFPARKTQYPRNLTAQGGAVASLSLGLISLVGVSLSVWGSWSPLGAIVTSVLGILMGAWGAFSQFRRAAIVGLVLACFTLAVSGFWGAVEIYVQVNGEDPFAPVLDESLDD